MLAIEMPKTTRFHSHEDRVADLERLCGAYPERATWKPLGESEEGRSLVAVEVGRGDRTVSLLAGAHSDEPVGPETLHLLARQLIAEAGARTDLLNAFRFVIIPHINPDGEARNRRWIEQWPDVRAYLAHGFREQPGRDLEFGYPGMRIENRLVSDYLRTQAPITLHASLHGMAFSEGGMLLIEPAWVERSGAIQSGFRAAVHRAGLRLHDHDRGGEKGFEYIAPGFTTTPRGAAMRAYFRGRHEPEVAARFHESSMEFVRGLGGDPLSLVTELPLFLVNKRLAALQPGIPAAYLAFKDRLPELTLRLRLGQSIDAMLEQYRITPLPLTTAMALQLRAIELGLQAVMG